MKKILSLVAFLSPSVVFAQNSPITDATSLSARLVSLGNTVIYLLISLAIIYIIWNIVQYFIKGSDDEGARKKSGWSIFYGIVGLAIILSIWGIVGILINTFRTAPPTQGIPNLGNSTSNGGIPSNQQPIVY